MPWLETAPVDERERFIADYRLDLYTITDLCARYNVSGRPATSGSSGWRRVDGQRYAIAAVRRTTARAASWRM